MPRALFTPFSAATQKPPAEIVVKKRSKKTDRLAGHKSRKSKTGDDSQSVVSATEVSITPDGQPLELKASKAKAPEDKKKERKTRMGKLVVPDLPSVPSIADESESKSGFWNGKTAGSQRTASGDGQLAGTSAANLNDGALLEHDAMPEGSYSYIDEHGIRVFVSAKPLAAQLGDGEQSFVDDEYHYDQYSRQADFHRASGHEKSFKGRAAEAAEKQLKWVEDQLSKQDRKKKITEMRFEAVKNKKMQQLIMLWNKKQQLEGGFRESGSVESFLKIVMEDFISNAIARGEPLDLQSIPESFHQSVREHLDKIEMENRLKEEQQLRENPVKYSNYRVPSLHVKEPEIVSLGTEAYEDFDISMQVDPKEVSFLLGPDLLNTSAQSTRFQHRPDSMQRPASRMCKRFV